MKNKKLFWKQMLGIYILLSIVIGISVTIVTAVDMHKSLPDKKMDVTINYNKYGEFNGEFFCVLIAIPGLIIGLLQKIKELDNIEIENGKEKRN